jgi:hypothetical protein
MLDSVKAKSTGKTAAGIAFAGLMQAPDCINLRQTNTTTRSFGNEGTD